MSKLNQLSIQALYPLALAEGEGVGTAYEYFVKRLAMRRWLAAHPVPGRILIAGLPQKYGSSLDFLLLADEMNTAVTVIDDRHDALNKARWAIGEAQRQGWLQRISPTLMPVQDITAMAEITQSYDLVISSEVVQRLDNLVRQQYVDRVLSVGTAVALFCPNYDNTAHVRISELGGVPLSELQHLAKMASAHVDASGYIDMPPFPPGIARTESQRQQAATGLAERVAMWGLGIYARLEQRLPTRWRQQQAHIVYALMRRP